MRAQARVELVGEVGGQLKLLLRLSTGALPESLLTYLAGVTGVKVRRSALLLPLDRCLFELVLGRLPPDQYTVQLGERVNAWLGRVREEERQLVALKQREDVPLGPEAERLWPFQRVAVDFLLHAHRCLLCDEPGLGKTAMAIHAVRLTHVQGRILVLCPNSLKRWWASEIARWHPGAACTVVEAAHRVRGYTEWKQSRKAGYLIVNWELLRLMPELAEFPWQWLICDEAHRAKNRKTKLFQALRRIQASRVVMVTATPFANSPDELWALLNILHPERYTSYWRFFEMYTDYRYTYGGFREIRGARNPELLRRELAPVMIRRTKKQCLPQLPPKLYKTIELGLTARQYEMYREMAREMVVELESGEELIALNAISRLLRLRQIVSTTATLDKSDHSSKLDAVVEMLQDVGRKQRFVIFCQFRPTVEALYGRLMRAGISTIWIMGGLGGDEITARVAAFQNEGAQAFVATLDTGGVGLTLTAAQNLVFVEKHFNPARQLQAEDRIHRPGQSQSCLITSLHCPGTVDDLVDKILQRKIQMTESILNQALLVHLKEFLRGDVRNLLAAPD